MRNWLGPGVFDDLRRYGWLAVMVGLSGLAPTPTAAAVIDDFTQFDGVSAPARLDDRRTETDLGGFPRLTRGLRDVGVFASGAAAGHVTWTGDGIDYGATVVSSESRSLSPSFGIEYRFASTPLDPGVELVRPGQRLQFHFDGPRLLDAPGPATNFGLSVALRGPGVSPAASESFIDLDEAFANGERTVALTFADLKADGVGFFDPANVGNMLVTLSSFAPAGGAGGTHRVTLERIEVVPLPAALPLFATAAAGLALVAHQRRAGRARA